MTKQQETRVCLNCKFSTCRGADNCPALQLDHPRKSIKVSLPRDLLMAVMTRRRFVLPSLKGRH